MISTLPLLGIYIILSIWILGFQFVFRHRLTCMAGMMSSMALGMSIGLGMGTLIAAWLPGQFFQATVLSMIIGGGIGALAGIPISIMAVLDGLLSGLMSGMMGSMLMVMIPSAFAGPTLKIMVVLCSGIVFLLLLMLQGEIKEGHLKQRSFILSKPLSMFVVIAFFFLVIHQTSILSADPSIDHASSMQSTPESQQEENHDHSGQFLSDQSSKVSKEWIVKASEFNFSPSPLHSKVNEQVRITLENTGKVEHDFEIIGTNVHLHAKPGKKESTIFSLDQPGEYKAVCTLPGHREAGMISIIRVSSA
jgi:heme/copper-type cytochrome/quinol oxidase subunit 2